MVMTVRGSMLGWGLPCLVAAIAVVLGACASLEPPAALTVRAGLGCVDDSARCRTKRRDALAALLADKTRSWVRQPADASAYASGVRLFAFKKRKQELNCSELSIAVKEARAARPILRAAAAQLTPAQIARGAMLGDEVGKELVQESRRRKCKA